MLFHLRQLLPKVKTAPVHKKPSTDFESYELRVYYNKNYAFIYSAGRHQLVVGFRNVAVVLHSRDKNETELLFNLTYKPDWNDNKHINYTIITSKSTIQKIREICNKLYELSDSDASHHPTILAEKRVFAYVMKHKKFVFYKLVKDTQGLKWEKDDEVRLYKGSKQKKGRYKQCQTHIGNRYYVLGDQRVEVNSSSLNKYYIVYDRFRIYDLYKRKIIESTTTNGIVTNHYNEHKAFSGLGLSHNCIFLVKNKVMMRPVVVTKGNFGATSTILFYIPKYNGNEKEIKIRVEFDGKYYHPIALLYSKNKCILVTKQEIFVYDLNQSSYEPLEEYDILHPQGGIDIDIMKLYKNKNFFILFDKYNLISAYYNKKDSQYYFKHIMRSAGDLNEFSVIGYLLSLNDSNDCIGIIMASRKQEIAVVAYDVIKKEIYLSIVKHDYLIARSKDINLLLRAESQRIRSQKLVLQLFNRGKLLENVMNNTQRNNKSYLSVVIHEDIKIVKEGSSSFLPLNSCTIYRLNNIGYVLIYEEPCLVHCIKDYY